MQLQTPVSALTEADRARVAAWLTSADAEIFKRCLRSDMLLGELEFARLAKEAQKHEAMRVQVVQAHQAVDAFAKCLGLLLLYAKQPEKLAIFTQLIPKLDADDHG